MITDTSKLYDDDDELWIKNFLEYIEHDDGVAAKRKSYERRIHLLRRT